MIPNERSPDAGTSRAPKMHALGGGVQGDSRRFGITARPLPPFGAEVEALQRAGQPVNVYAFAGARAWDRARLRRDAHGPGSAMVLQDDGTPDRWRWPRVDAVVLACIDVEPGRALAIARAAVAAGVRCVVVCGLDRPAIVRRAAA